MIFIFQRANSQNRFQKKTHESALFARLLVRTVKNNLLLLLYNFGWLWKWEKYFFIYLESHLTFAFEHWQYHLIIFFLSWRKMLPCYHDFWFNTTIEFTLGLFFTRYTIHGTHWRHNRNLSIRSSNSDGGRGRSGQTITSQTTFSTVETQTDSRHSDGYELARLLAMIESN